MKPPLSPESPDVLDATQAQFVFPTEHDQRAVQHYAAEFLKPFGDSPQVVSTPQPGQKVALYANNAETVRGALLKYPSNLLFLVMTRATRFEADSVLRQRSDVIVETVTE